MEFSSFNVIHFIPISLYYLAISPIQTGSKGLNLIFSKEDISKYLIPAF